MDRLTGLNVKLLSKWIVLDAIRSTDLHLLCSATSRTSVRNALGSMIEQYLAEFRPTHLPQSKTYVVTSVG